MALSPTSSRGGGFTPVSAVLECTALDVASAAGHPIKWTAARDNIWDQNAILVLPPGLGISAVFNGSVATLTVDTSGVYALTYNINVTGDATWRGVFNDGLVSQQPIDLLKQVGSLESDTFQTMVVYLPSGATNPPTITTTVGATGACAASVYLSIVRLA